MHGNLTFLFTTEIRKSCKRNNGSSDKYQPRSERRCWIEIRYELMSDLIWTLLQRLLTGDKRIERGEERERERERGWGGGAYILN